MYEIQVDFSTREVTDIETLYHPNSKTKVVLSAKIHEALDDIGYMEATIPEINPIYERIVAFGGRINVLKDDNLIWTGHIRDVSIDFKKNKKIYCVGDLVILQNSAQQLYSYNGTKAGLLNYLINYHNSTSTPIFSVGIVGKDATKTVEAVVDWGMSTLDAIRTLVCDDGDYIKLHYIENSEPHYVIDVLPIADYGKRTEQFITFGENLLDYTQNISGEDIATRCIPLGVSIDSNIEGHENYMTCADANDHSIVVENPEAVARYGAITKTVHFNVLDTPEALLSAGRNYLESAQFAKMSLELTALDLSIMDASIESYEVGDYVRAVCKPYGMDTWLPVRQKDTDIMNPANNKIVVGEDIKKTFTKSQNSILEEIAKVIPSKSNIIDIAKRNASNMINSNGDNGHVVLKTNDKGVVSEILIMDTSDIETATKMWRWNEGGFGFRRRDNIGSEWFDYDVAITMDGDIVADAITTGTMYADRIKGGTLTLGGANNESGTLSLRDENNNEVSNMTKNGLNIRKGKIELGTIVFDNVEYPNTIIDDSGNISIGAYNKPNAGKTPAFKVYSDGSLLMRNLLQITANNNDTFMSFGGTWGDSLTVMVNNNHEAGLGVAHQSDKFRYAVYMHYNDIRWYNNDYNPRYAMFGPTQESDIRLKKNIKEVDKQKISELFKRFHFVTFNYKNPKDTYLHHGLIAQEVEELMDEIGFDKDDYIEKAPKNPNDGELYYQLMYTSLSRLAMIAIQDLYEKIETLETKIKTLKEGE